MANDTDYGAFLPTTDVFDRTTIDALDINSPEFKDFLVRLYQTTNNIANSVNIRDAGYYVQDEFVNGQLWFENPALSSTTSQAPEHRQVWRKVINFGALPNTAIKSVAHGLTVTDDYTFTRIYGAASDTTGHVYLPLPYMHVAIQVNDIGLFANATDVVIQTGVDRTAYDTCYVILEYIKQ